MARFVGVFAFSPVSSRRHLFKSIFINKSEVHTEKDHLFAKIRPCRSMPSPGPATTMLKGYAISTSRFWRFTFFLCPSLNHYRLYIPTIVAVFNYNSIAYSTL